MRTLGRSSVASFIRVALACVQAGTGFSLVLAVLFTLGLPFTKAPVLTVTVPVSYRVDNASLLRGRPGFGFHFFTEKQALKGAGRVDRIDGALLVPGSNRGFIGVNAVIMLLVLAAFWYLLSQLRAVFQTLSAGTPFVPENAARIRRVALTIIIGELFRAAVVFGENAWAAGHVPIAGVTYDTWPRLQFEAIGYGLIILVIAEVFRAGTRLDEEQSLTI